MADDSRITPQAEDFAAWYNEVVQAARLVDYSPVRGCMVIRPFGYAIWELMQGALDGTQNLFIEHQLLQAEGHLGL